MLFEHYYGSGKFTEYLNLTPSNDHTKGFIDGIPLLSTSKRLRRTYRKKDERGEQLGITTDDAYKRGRRQTFLDGVYGGCGYTIAAMYTQATPSTSAGCQYSCIIIFNYFLVLVEDFIKETTFQPRTRSSSVIVPRIFFVFNYFQ